MFGLAQTATKLFQDHLIFFLRNFVDNVGACGLSEASRKGVEVALRYEILNLDLDRGPCPVGTCGRVAEVVRGYESRAPISLQTTTVLPSRGTAAVPDLVFLRPSRNKSLEDMTRSIKRRWPHSSILGMLCIGWEVPKHVCQSALNNMDDFVSCPFTERDLLLRIQRLMYSKSTATDGERPMVIAKDVHFESLVGGSQSFLRVLEKIPLGADSNVTVLISGETGTGKELFARAIHYHGARQDKPFVPVNCGAFPDQLFESELFGHTKGAFTDASSAQMGLIAEAEAGTLFLDEVDSLSLSAQVKLLRFLQDGEYRPLGSNRLMRADVRVIAATNADLARQIELGRFREDLYYRLNVLPLSIPPLRERLQDIPQLASHFLRHYAVEHGREPSRLSPGAVQKLMFYPWPGNVRELEALIQRTVLLRSAPILRPEDIDLPFANSARVSEHDSLRTAKTRAIEGFERVYLERLLATHRGNITRAARAAGKERRAFQRLLRKYNLDRRSFQI